MKTKCKIFVFFLIPQIILHSCNEKGNEKEAHEGLPSSGYAILVHGGSGSFTGVDKNRADSLLMVIRMATSSGYDVLQNGGTAMDAVTNTIIILENHPFFNAGKGSVLTKEGHCELDASVMNGKDLNAGAVAGITGIKNPILAAKEVMIHSEHVMLSGKGAYEFAVSRGLEQVSPSYFFTNESLKRHKDRVNKDEKYGTVGCIALDRSGNIAAGTSTGGTSHKQYGRIGDSPVIGAGTYARNSTCGVSCTGIGEYFIRLSVAHDISSMIEYRNLTVQQAVDTIIRKKLPALGGKGGIIAMDRYGHTGIGFNTRAMLRGYKKSDGTEDYQLY